MSPLSITLPELPKSDKTTLPVMRDHFARKSKVLALMVRRMEMLHPDPDLDVIHILRGHRVETLAAMVLSDRLKDMSSDLNERTVHLPPIVTLIRSVYRAESPADALNIMRDSWAHGDLHAWGLPQVIDPETPMEGLRGHYARMYLNGAEFLRHAGRHFGDRYHAAYRRATDVAHLMCLADGAVRDTDVTGVAKRARVVVAGAPPQALEEMARLWCQD